VFDANHSGGILAALGTVRANLEMIARLRREPGDPALSPQLLKHSDEQTVVGLAALLQARSNGNLGGEDVSRWGIVAAPQHVGRTATADTLTRFTRRGVTGASPLIVPHRSLHSISGTISEALGIHGPNLAVSGGPGNLAEGLLAALTLLNENRLPGIWVVLTQWDPEPALPNEAPIEAFCQAQALVLMPGSSGRAGQRIRLVRPDQMPRDNHCLRLPALAELHKAFSSSGRQLFRFDWGGGMELGGTEVPAESAA
jgi:hypothetical protein